MLLYSKSTCTYRKPAHTVLHRFTVEHVCAGAVQSGGLAGRGRVRTPDELKDDTPGPGIYDRSLLNVLMLDVCSYGI